MRKIQIKISDGTAEKVFSDITSLQELQSRYTADIVSFFSDSESDIYQVFISEGGITYLTLTISCFCSLEWLLGLGASLYAQGSVISPTGDE